jgi:hypothetical protein
MASIRLVQSCLHVTQFWRGEARTNLRYHRAHNNFLILFILRPRPSLQTDYGYQSKTLTVHGVITNAIKLTDKPRPEVSPQGHSLTVRINLSHSKLSILSVVIMLLGTGKSKERIVTFSLAL